MPVHPLRRFHASGWLWLGCWLGLMVAAPAAAGAQSAPAVAQFAAAAAARYTPVLRAYGTVAPAYLVPVNAAEAGVLAAFTPLAGMRVRAGEKLGRLQGPALAAALAQRQATLRAADAQRAAARSSLAIVRRQLATHLSTNAMVQQATAALAQARAAAANAQSALAVVQAMQTITAPVAGTVTALAAAAGELVQPGQTLFTLRPRRRLWLQAEFYGADAGAVRVGMAGRFTPAGGQPAGGQPPVAVRVTTVAGALAPDGGETVELSPRGAPPPWLAGEFGSLTVHLPARTLLAIPTRALILDRARSWVLVRTRRGLRRQQVAPGPARGWQTYIEHGLRTGDQVVVTNAYLLFHQNIAAAYTPPD